jgi:acyl-CoA thioester hydrolase
VDGFNFETPIRVRFDETDAQGVAHNSNYFVWFEVARIDYLERHAGGYQRLRDQGIESLVLESHARFLAPALFDDRLLVHARCLDVRGARFRFEYVVTRDGVAIADGWTRHGTVDAMTLRPTRLPAWLVAAVATAEAAVPSA